jgi:hypothetical protein
MGFALGLITTIAVLGLVLCFVLMYRNSKTYELRTKVLDLCSKYDNRNIDDILSGKKKSSLTWFYERLPSYDSMMMSFKKLELESFMNEEEINKLINE